MHNLKKISILLILCLLCCFFTFCSKKNNAVIIQGLNTDKVYLYKCFDSPLKPIDSAQVINDSFKFEYHPDTAFEPVMVDIGYHDNKDNKFKSLGIIDPYIASSNKPGLYVSLYMEPGEVKLTGDLSKTNGIHLVAGPQNEFYFRNIDLAFRTFGNDNALRKSRINAFKKLIKNNPDAHWGMFSLQNFKSELKKHEMQSIFAEFDSSLKTTYTGRQLQRYIYNMLTDDTELRSNPLLQDSDNRLVSLIDTTKKVNMVIFWASWCGPCNKEIPMLKKIAADFKDPNFRMVSASIDKSVNQWNSMRKLRAMHWQQLLIQKNELDKVTAQYNLQFIPQIYFIDNNRKLLKHFNGYDPNSEDIYRKIIITALNNQTN